MTNFISTRTTYQNGHMVGQSLTMGSFNKDGGRSVSVFGGPGVHGGREMYGNHSVFGGHRMHGRHGEWGRHGDHGRFGGHRRHEGPQVFPGLANNNFFTKLFGATSAIASTPFGPAINNIMNLFRGFGGGGEQY